MNTETLIARSDASKNCVCVLTRPNRYKEFIAQFEADKKEMESLLATITRIASNLRVP